MPAEDGPFQRRRAGMFGRSVWQKRRIGPLPAAAGRKPLAVRHTQAASATAGRRRGRARQRLLQQLACPWVADATQGGGRATFESVQFKEGVEKMEDLTPGMELNGVVTNITNFGAFVDVGVHQDGLVHISAMSDTFVKNPADFLKVGQKVKVRVIEIDIARKRINLSMRKHAVSESKPKSKGKPQEPKIPPRKELYRW